MYFIISFSKATTNPAIIKLKQPLHIRKVGYDYGLTVVINQMLEDYCNTLSNAIGTLTYILDSTDYLDELSGSLVMRILQSDEELFISINAMPVFGSDTLKAYSPRSRECYFEEETDMRR